jgi:hypothetical protein
VSMSGASRIAHASGSGARPQIDNQCTVVGVTALGTALFMLIWQDVTVRMSRPESVCQTLLIDYCGLRV